MLKCYFSKLSVIIAFIGFFQTAIAQNVAIISPISIAGIYPARAAHLFGPPLSNVTGEFVLVDDGQTIDVNGDGTNNGSVTDGCEAILNDISGKIALIDRGECAFPTKAVAAQAAGALAVVICNNTPAQPHSLLYMAGPDPGTLTIPTVIISYSSCQTIKSQLGNGPVLGGTNPAAAGENCENALQAVLGLNAAPAATGGSALFNTSISGLFYRFTPTTNGTMTVSSCGSTLDTWAYILGDGCNVLTYLADNDDCDFNEGEYGSTVSTFVTAGSEYVIYWDDANSIAANDPFDWNLTLAAPPQVSVTFQVDMQNETVATDGVKISLNGGALQDMADGGNGIWIYSTSLAAGDLVNYTYYNGSASAETNPALNACRSLTLGTDPITLPVVCFNECAACSPLLACPLLVEEDFEGYALGGIADQSMDWIPWPLPSNPANDADVSDDQAFGGTQSLKIAEASDDDVLLLLGNVTSGNYILKWKLFVPTGSGAFFSLQKDQNNIGVAGLQVEFYPNGTGDIDAGATNNYTFTYPHDKWFEVYHAIDLDNDLIRLWIDGKMVHEWPFSWQAFQQSGLKQLGAIDFYGDTDNLFYVDNIELKTVEACPAGAIICDGFDGYDLGSMAGKSPWWTTWTADTPDEFGVVSNEQFLSCEKSLEISEANADDQLLLLGLRTAGNYQLSFNMYVPTGSAGYYNILKKAGPATVNEDFACAAYFGVDGNCTLNIGSPNVATVPFPHDTWFSIVHQYDLDNDVAKLYINGEFIGLYPASITATLGPGANQIGAVDFFGEADTRFFVDDVLFLELPPLVGDACATANDLNPYLGGGLNNTISTPLFDNTGYVLNPNDPTNGWGCFGEPTGNGASPELNNTIWFTFTGDGNSYNIETGACGATNYIDDGDTQMAIYAGTSCSTLVPIACNEDSPNATNTDLFAGLDLSTTPGTQYYMLIDGFNFNGNALSEGEFCINFTQLTEFVPTVEVTFQVDMTWVLDAGGTIEGIKMAGNFADVGANLTNWDPPSSPIFTHIGNDVYEATVAFPVSSTGADFKFKFLNTTDTWGDCHVNQECLDNNDATCKNATTDDRLLEIPDANQTICYTWDTCEPCNTPNGTSEQLAIPIRIAPNPFSSKTIVEFGEPILGGEAKLTNLTGQLVRSYELSGNQLTIKREDLMAGMYFLQVRTEKGATASIKLVIE